MLTCLLLGMAPIAFAQDPEDAESRELGEDFDHENWYTLEMLIFSRPLEDASALANDDPNLEQLQVRRQIKLPALMKTLVPNANQINIPPNIGLLNDLLNSYKYRATAEASRPGTIPELEEFIAWLGTIRERGNSGLGELERVDTAGQYWPYIEPLFAKKPKLLTAAVPSSIETEKPMTIDGFTDEEDAIEVTIPQDLAFQTSNNLQLNDEADSLASSGRYKVMWHKAWHQPLPPRGKGVPLLIRGKQSKIDGTDTPTGSLDGLVTVELGRFLHARIQLWAEALELRELRERDQGYIEFDARVRLRSKEYHYLDHPYLGVIILIVPLTPKPDRLSPERYSF